MHSAFNDNHADSKATRIARLAVRAVLACALAAGAGSAFAQQYGDRSYGDRREDQGMQAMQQQRERFSLPQQDRDQRQAEMRAYEEQRRAQQQQQQQQQDAGRRGSGRLTPDERRDLRRQINEAGMDLYPQRRR